MLISTVYLDEFTLMAEVGLVIIRQYAISYPFQRYFKHAKIHKIPLCIIEIGEEIYTRSKIDIVFPGFIICNSHLIGYGSTEYSMALSILGSIIYYFLSEKHSGFEVPYSLVALPTMCIGLYAGRYLLKYKSYIKST